MQDYQSNSKKAKAEQDKGSEAKPKVPAEKNLEKVILGDAVIQKKTIGKKAKDLIVDADLKGAAREAVRHVFSDVLVPSAKRTAYDMYIDFGKRTIFRGTPSGARNLLDPRGLMQRITYNSPVQRSIMSGLSSDSRDTRSIAPPIQAAQRQPRSDVEGVFVGSKEEAELVLEKMSVVLEAYEVVSVHDLKELLGHPRDHVDQKWGWISIADVSIRQVPQGWFMEFSAPMPIQAD